MAVPLRALLIEDSEDDAALLLRVLQRGGYDVTFERVDAPAGLLGALEKEWDVVICDYSLPYFSGTEALQLIRSRGLEMPFIFVSGTIGEETAVAALKQGAQDYLMKDNLKRLLPAIERELLESQHRRERKHLEQHVQQLQKFEAIGRLAGGIAHDFNNVLGVIMGWAQIGCDESLTDSATHKKFEAILQQARRAAALTAQLLAFARRQILQPENLNLNDVVRQTITLLQAGMGKEIEFEIILSPDVQTVRADPTQVEQVLMNLCFNARDAMPKGGRLTLETRDIEIDEKLTHLHPHSRAGQYALLSVSDTGVGMDAATLDRIFEPFFTTKEMGKGTGLGLATVYGIVKQHGGFINVYSEPGHGTTFHVYFPVSSGPIAMRTRETDRTVMEGTETILVAEDHDGLRELAHETLAALGYKVILATNGQEAVSLFQANSQDIRLLVFDVVMPLLAGPQAYDQIRALRPDVPIIFTTGHAVELASLNSRAEEGAVLLRKPYTPQELSRTVRRTLDRKN